jgi:Tfp pilus assembly protein PilF
MAKRPQSAGRGGSALARARALWGQCRHDEALRCFNEAIREAPNDLAVLLEASRAFAARYRHDRAGDLIGRALRWGARQGDVQLEAGLAYLKLGRPTEAEGCFRRAARLAPDARAHLELAKIHERRHALDDADNAVGAALSAAPGLAAAWLIRARIDRRRGDTDRAYATLRRVIAGAKPSMPELPELYGELCTLLDSIGQHDAAWDAMVEGKRLQRAYEAPAWHAAQFVTQRCSQAYRDLAAEDYARWNAAGPVGEPCRVALLTGFPRSGTTLLEQLIDAHPDAVSSEEKEVFGADVLPLLGEGVPVDAPLAPLLDSLSSERIAAARKLYLDALQAIAGEPIGSRLHVDKNPAMIPMIPAMRRVFPELKLLVALRDPRDVILSCFLRWLPVNGMSVWFLTPERTAARYRMDLEGWLHMRELLSDWAEIRYEDLVADVAGQARRALDALGLPWNDVVLNYRQGRRLVLSPSYDAVAKPVYSTSIGRWRHYAHRLASILDGIAPLVSALGYAD